jgi:hypothetical protein
MMDRVGISDLQLLKIFNQGRFAFLKKTDRMQLPGKAEDMKK